MMKKVSQKTKWIFAVGQLGWSILSGIIANLLVNFYLPDSTGNTALYLFCEKYCSYVTSFFFGIRLNRPSSTNKLYHFFKFISTDKT
jgi:hypothetical protein